MVSAIKAFLKLESASGILLIIAALLAVALANSPFSNYYDLLLDTPVEIRVGAIQIAKPLLLWVNDGLMAVFFFVVGLELKREILEGELASAQAIALPAFGALGGMVAPALIYILMNGHDPVALKGWAIPTATDIAFALAILTLLGKRVPLALKTFLVSLAIFDDIGAIIIIAIFFTSNISAISLIVGAVCIVALALLNRMNIYKLTPYLLFGLVMWVAVLKSGVHATLAGVLLAMFIPLAREPKSGRSPLKDMERDLHSIVAFAILPIFAFSNSGLNVSAMGIEEILHPATIGIALGLFIGKQLGVFTFAWLAVKTGLAKLPTNVNWSMIYGVSLLCGIGFTMSLFIGSLAFESSGDNLLFDERLGIIVASTLSALCGYFWLNKALSKEI
ncbi:MAG: Na+/H+ antiporter NhaA [Zetaproteobacteria bacterium CG12_big_fil_rev_8_21_14_0_65_55_1124]|nr:MAG: Na(+)/H(+) antiporter NhaA [Zetaproteobacteria bacterium CG1_02_55_237]PIS19425.1 MAG: Na+/H+ antiporter NhaA [Zetaproteobacteria bacterium CG08_land_8_20_14_0_20_55_17]PIW42995.1 MAG: Na+/H+ antiporter NhaA [Zetaproteobacteria bacterium CG12_big_fil_rev_8_21_14_0_65_55_1124]PIY51537.1 MAG: Na+/H+ antiporter NhaA [Zetaproteobacteria bacterium CG_4_10_14_0_8_um_filter_55_43]PIZ39223.1 MAG: Na+/H+ antiporter NhaA [Zetaproteobacteria bacterium CG_4_10_14_0_2_um_filter_55_20]PJB80149.1 MAG